MKHEGVVDGTEKVLWNLQFVQGHDRHTIGRILLSIDLLKLKLLDVANLESPLELFLHFNEAAGVKAFFRLAFLYGALKCSVNEHYSVGDVGKSNFLLSLVCSAFFHQSDALVEYDFQVVGVKLVCSLT